MTVVRKKKVVKKRAAKDVRARMAEVVIRVVAPEGADPATWNPRRAGTDAHRHFENMKGGATIREYLAKYPEGEHRQARQWLYNTVRDGYVKTLGG